MLTFAQTESWNTAKYEQGSWYYIISYTLHCTFKLWENQQPQRNTSPARMVLAKMQRYPKAYHLSCYIGSSSNSANGYFLSRKSMTDPGNFQRGYQGSSRVPWTPRGCTRISQVQVSSVSLFACFVVSYLHSEIHIITYVHTYIIYLSCPIPINCSYNSYIGIRWYKYITTIYKHID
jgi:hypothetical protein